MMLIVHDALFHFAINFFKQKQKARSERYDPSNTRDWDDEIDPRSMVKILRHEVTGVLLVKTF